MSKLEAAACDRVVVDSMARRGAGSEMLGGLVSRLAQGDSLVVLQLHHISRVPVHLVETILRLHDRGIWIEVVDSNFDTSNAVVSEVVKMLADHIRRSTSGGRGETGRASNAGRRRLLADDAIARARKLMAEGGLTAADIAGQLGVSRATLYRSLRQNGQA